MEERSLQEATTGAERFAAGVFGVMDLHLMTADAGRRRIALEK